MIQIAGALRWSYGARAWFGDFRVLDDGRIWLRHELTWFNQPPEVAARDIISAQTEWKAPFDYIVANPEIFPKADEYGETISETFRRAGVPIRRGTDDRVAAFSRLRSWLSTPHGDGQSFLVHPSCSYFLRTIPTLLAAKTNPDDVESVPEEYPALAAALFVMSRPMPGDEDTPLYPEGAIGYDVDEMRRACAE